MEIKKAKRVKVTGRPDLGFGEVLRIQESDGQHLADVAFQVGDLRILETYPSREWGVGVKP